MDSPFADDWRESLQEHYKDVVRRDDTVAEGTLVPLLNQIGFSDDELRQLKLKATIRTEGVADGFVPDLNIHKGCNH